jgi:hypothetical protein
MGFGIVSTDRSISAASGDPVRYRSGFFSPSSCDETPPPWEDADAGSLRPLAWDFRRFRFSRNARFSRSCLESLPPAGRFAAVGSCPGPLFSSSVIVDLFDAQPRMIGAWTDGRTIRIGTLPRQCLERWHRFVASGDATLRPPLLSEHIVFHSRFVQSPIPGRPALRGLGPCGKDRPALSGRFGRFHRSGHAAVAQW